MPSTHYRHTDLGKGGTGRDVAKEHCDRVVEQLVSGEASMGSPDDARLRLRGGLGSSVQDSVDLVDQQCSRRQCLGVWQARQVDGGGVEARCKLVLLTR